MIIGVSIVDKHKPEGQRHVGTYIFEVDYPRDGHFDFLTVSCRTEAGEDSLRPFIGRLLSKNEIPNPTNGRGEPIVPRCKFQVIHGKPYTQCQLPASHEGNHKFEHKA